MVTLDVVGSPFSLDCALIGSSLLRVGHLSSQGQWRILNSYCCSIAPMSWLPLVLPGPSLSLDIRTTVLTVMVRSVVVVAVAVAVATWVIVAGL